MARALGKFELPASDANDLETVFSDFGVEGTSRYGEAFSGHRDTAPFGLKHLMNMMPLHLLEREVCDTGARIKIHRWRQFQLEPGVANDAVIGQKRSTLKHIA